MFSGTRELADILPMDAARMRVLASSTRIVQSRSRRLTRRQRIVLVFILRFICEGEPAWCANERGNFPRRVSFAASGSHRLIGA